jgi:hypothetical protein
MHPEVYKRALLFFGVPLGFISLVILGEYTSYEIATFFFSIFITILVILGYMGTMKERGSMTILKNGLFWKLKHIPFLKWTFLLVLFSIQAGIGYLTFTNAVSFSSFFGFVIFICTLFMTLLLIDDSYTKTKP